MAQKKNMLPWQCLSTVDGGYQSIVAKYDHDKICKDKFYPHVMSLIYTSFVCAYVGLCWWGAGGPLVTPDKNHIVRESDCIKLDCCDKMRFGGFKYYSIAVSPQSLQIRKVQTVVIFLSTSCSYILNYKTLRV